MSRRSSAEAAFKDAIEMNGNLVALDRFARPHTVIEDTIDSAQYIMPHPLYQTSSLYFIKLRRTGLTVQIEEKKFTKDADLLQSFQISGIEVKIVQSPKKTAQLLRQEINRRLKPVYVSCYTGWQVQGEDNYQYDLFPGGTTHMQILSDGLPIPHFQPVSSAVAAAAAARFWEIFRICTNTFSRWMIFIVFHEAALHTLLKQLGYHTPSAFALFSDNVGQTTYLKQLYSWFGDAVLSPEKSTTNLSFSLLFRKDQPIVIEDCGRLNNQAQNMEILRNVFVNNEVSLKIDRKQQTFPIQGPLVILSRRASALTVAPEVIVLDIPPESFNKELWLQLEDRIADNCDYLTAFVSFTETHIPELLDSLKWGRRVALQNSDGELTEKCTEILGIFTGIDCFLNYFFQFCSPATLPISPFREVQENFMELLLQTSEREQHSSLADHFLLVGRSQIEQGKLQTCHLRCTPVTDTSCSVFFDETSLYFVPKAFFHVCEALAQSRPCVVSALAEAGLLKGQSTNATTEQTRITVYAAESKSRKSISVYAIDRKAFDEIRLGDPLVLDGEEM